MSRNPCRCARRAPRRERLRSNPRFDEAAERLGIDPVELRVRNFADHDQEAGRPWSSNSLLECYRVGAERFGWSQRPAQGAATDGRWRIGWGMASTLYPAIRQACRVRVKLAADASLCVQCGTQDMGSGTYTALGQMAASALGIPPSQVTRRTRRYVAAGGSVFRRLAGDREPCARDRNGDGQTPRDAGEHGRDRRAVAARPANG